MDLIASAADIIKYLKTLPNNEKAFNDFQAGNWNSTSTEEFLKLVKDLTLGLLALGVKKGDRISLLAYPSTAWTAVDLAIMLVECVSVPIFPNISNENLEFQVNQADARILFLGDNIDPLYQAHKMLFTKVITIGNAKIEGAITLHQFRSMGQEYEKLNENKFDELLKNIDSKKIATIIYTSGTTGVPKGAEVTHEALCRMLSYKRFGWDAKKDRYLNILPLAHVFGRVMNLCLASWGVPVYYLNDAKEMAAVCQQIHPTILIVVPRLLEKVYAKMLDKVDNAGFFKRAIGHWAFDLANDEQDDSIFKQLLHPIADTVVYSALREAFGGEVRIIISGGAPLDPHLAHFFIDIGLPIYEGWGMTEAATITVNKPDERKIGTVGTPLDDIEIKISSEGEILVKGPNMMIGYYKNEEATKKAFTEDGYLKTGDKGRIDEDGFLTIIGRVKELLKTSTGEYVVPTPIEQQLVKIPLVDMAMVVAEKRKYTTCLLFLDADLLHKLKNSKGLANISDEEYLENPELKKEMQNAIDKINLHLNKSERIQDFKFVPHVPSIEAGELTPSMKIRRDFVEEKYKELIDRMYP